MPGNAIITCVQRGEYQDDLVNSTSDTHSRASQSTHCKIASNSPTWRATVYQTERVVQMELRQLNNCNTSPVCPRSQLARVEATSGGSLVAHMVKNLPAIQEAWVQSLAEKKIP